MENKEIKMNSDVKSPTPSSSQEKKVYPPRETRSGSRSSDRPQQRRFNKPRSAGAPGTKRGFKSRKQARGRSQFGAPPATHISTTTTKFTPSSLSQLKVCTLSGTDSIGRNCSFVELGNEIIVIDCGLGFPNDEQLGVDYLIPNFRYLQKNKHKIKGVIITHGHLDHTGGLPYVLPEIGFPPVYAGRFAKALIDEKLKEFNLTTKAKIVSVHKNSEMQIGSFKVSFIGLTHSIPNSFGVYIESPKGNLFFSGDYKMDLDPANEEQSDYAALEAIKGKIDLALLESTNASSPGKSKSGKEIEENIENVIKLQNGRIIVVAFSSIISRIHSIINVAQRTNRKVFISGRSLHQSVTIAKDLGYINAPEGLILDERRVKEFPDNQVLFLCTGSQGERFGALNRISHGEHNFFKIKKGDTVLLAASEIPTNINEISYMTDRIIRLGGDIIQNDTWRIHESGHGLQEDMKMMYELIKPRGVLPIHGELTRRYKNKANYVNWGMKDDDVYLTDDGVVWAFDGKSWSKAGQVESKPIMVDGLGVGDIGDIVLKDRQQLAEYGMVTVILNLSSKTNHLIGRPRFLSRGFVYVKNSKNLFNELENLARDTHRSWYSRSSSKKKFETSELIGDIEQRFKKHIFKVTEREPMILVVTL